jgi:hypothetical protein
MTVVGVRPWLPWPLSRWDWWARPVPAERLAALRIGLALVLLLDVLLTYLPSAGDFFGTNGLPGPDAFGQGKAYWSLLRGLESEQAIRLAMLGWAVVVVGLLVGAATRFCAVATWALSVSFSNLNQTIENAGDTVRAITLFYLMLCPCGAAWSVDARLRRRSGPVFVHPWPLRLLFIQMGLIYFCNGIHKVIGFDWPQGDSLYYVLGDWSIARWSYAEFRAPSWVTRPLTWLVLGWELSFPLLVLWRPIRRVALAVGVAFHVGIFLSLELGGFAPYMLCLYLPLLPWERWLPDSAQAGQGGALDGEKVVEAHGDADAVVAGVVVDAALHAQGGVAGSGQAEQAAERRDAAGQ